MAITNASRLADFGTGIGTEGAVIDIDNANAQVGLGTTNPNSTVTIGPVGASGTSLFVHGDGRVTGVLTAGNFSGNLTGAVTSSGALSVTDTTSSTSTTTGALKVSGGIGVAKSIFVGEGISIAGTITYNDVTNIDSIGIVTAGKGLRATTGGLIVSAGVSTIGGKLSVSGITSVGDVVSSGIITADSYYGSGANLSGVGVVGVNTTGFSTFKDVAISGIATFKDTVDVSSGILTAPGIIAQTAQYDNTGRTTISDSYTGCGSQTITPKHATSKILVLVSFPFGIDSNDASVDYILANFRLMWNHSGISETQLQHKRYSLNLPENDGTDMIILGSCEIMYLHDHNTTNEITYEIQGKTAQNSSGLEVISGGSGTDNKTITLLEIFT